MAWQQLIARVSRQQVPEVESVLELAGAASITLEDADEAPLFEPQPGETPLWPTVRLKALFTEGMDMAAVQALVADVIGESTAVAAERLADEDLRAQGGGRFEPLRVGPRLWLISADDPDPQDGGAVLRLHRGMAFGTGEHPTTALCLEWIDASLGAGTVVLDYGCGSGVLALAALRLGAARAFAVDNDPQALAATKANAALNGLADRLWIGAPEALPEFRADVVLANILVRPLIELAPFFAVRLVTGGHIVLSGVLSAQREELERAYASRFDAASVAEREGWIRLEARKRASFGCVTASGHVCL
jgi:ribosomal protein L11 methyltransferase